MTEPESQALERARAGLAAAARVVVLTGAGVSAESGVPTFRGEEGLWRGHRPEDLATPEAFARDPRRVWAWYAWRREVVARCRPNAAHRALARWAVARSGVTIVTQNVDGLHAAAAIDVAGPDAAATGAWPIELHGGLFRTRCTACGDVREGRDPIDPDPPPRCRGCGGLLRPDVVWFGEPLDAGALGRAFEAARSSDACLVVGTSAAVHPAASVATTAVRAGAFLVVVDPAPTPLTALADVAVRDTAARATPRVVADGAGPVAPNGVESIQT